MYARAFGENDVIRSTLEAKLAMEGALEREEQDKRTRAELEALK